jgi:3-methyladenine DNA glycosylase AlkD
MALGEIGTAESVAVLEKAKKDKEPLVRAAVNEALKEIES